MLIWALLFLVEVFLVSGRTISIRTREEATFFRIPFNNSEELTIQYGRDCISYRRSVPILFGMPRIVDWKLYRSPLKDETKYDAAKEVLAGILGKEPYGAEDTVAKDVVTVADAFDSVWTLTSSRLVRTATKTAKELPQINKAAWDSIESCKIDVKAGKSYCTLKFPANMLKSFAEDQELRSDNIDHFWLMLNEVGDMRCLSPLESKYEIDVCSNKRTVLHLNDDSNHEHVAYLHIRKTATTEADLWDSLQTPACHCTLTTVAHGLAPRIDMIFNGVRAWTAEGKKPTRIGHRYSLPEFVCWDNGTNSFSRQYGNPGCRESDAVAKRFEVTTKDIPPRISELKGLVAPGVPITNETFVGLVVIRAVGLYTGESSSITVNCNLPDDANSQPDTAKFSLSSIGPKPQRNVLLMLTLVVTVS